MVQEIESLTIRQPGRPDAGSITLRIGERGPEIKMTGPKENPATGEIWCSSLKLICGLRPTIEIGDPTGKPLSIDLPPAGVVDAAHWERIWKGLTG